MTPGGGSLHFAVGPLIALGAVVVLMLLCRWAFGTGRAASTPVRRPADAASSSPAEPYGLLVPVLSSPDAAEAEHVRAVLREHGIRSTAVPTAGGHEVRVFPDDVQRARSVAG